MKKIFLLFFASLLVLSCTKDAELADSSADLSTTLAQYDDTNMGVYKGLFTTVGTMERGTIEINITPGNYGVATLNLVSGQVINFRADRTIAAGAELQDLVFSSSSVIASFKLSADLDGNNVQISDVMYKGITSGAIAAHETSRAPVTPITGVLACDDCDAHPLLVTGDTGTFSLLFVGDGSADDTVSALADVGAPAPLTIEGAQEGCADNGDGTTSCNVSGFETIGTNDISFDGTHSYNNTGDCSSAAGGWTLDSGNHGNFGGTFTSDTASCAAPANDLCGDAAAIACGGTDSGSTALASNIGDPADGCGTTASAAGGVWYTFSGTASGDTVTIDTEGSAFDTKLFVYTGACGALVCFGGDDDGGTGTLSSFSFTDDTAQDYSIYLAGFSTNAGDYTINVGCVPFSAPDFVPNCGDTAWTDDGGSTGDYSTGINEVHTIDGGAGNVVTANFSAFALENEWDYMAFYDGATTGDVEILTSDLGAVGGPSPNNGHHGFTGSQLLADGVTSSGQFLTIEFQSDTSVGNPGWVGSVDCAPPPPTSNGGDKAVIYNVKATQAEIAKKKAILRELGLN